ncbi:MAG: hypothetical protein IJT27_01020 [Clostridia bacterium]|nr:hypothetical protein [Clostridia bacterium]
MAEKVPCRDAMCEEFIFGENGLLNSFDAVRSDLTVVLDDGWDVPFGTTDTRLFGTLEADPERFPSLRGLDPVQRLKELSDRVRALGYRGLGLWVPTQTPSVIGGKEISLSPQEERAYWEERAKWCGEAGILYWKADWGKHQGDADYCRMMTACARKYAPALAVEHGFVGRPLLESEETGHDVPEAVKNYLHKVYTVSDYLRTYDVVHELKYASTIDRAAICLAEAQKTEGRCAVLNIEDTGLIGAALGCAVGVMRHDLEKKLKSISLPPRPVYESACAVIWQRIAPAFPANAGELHISDERLKDVWHCPKRAKNLWPDLPEGDYYVTAPLSVSRNMPLPQIRAAGEKPYVVCSINPENGALCVAVTPRTFGEKIDVTPRAEIYVKGGSASVPVGLFGEFDSLSVEFGEHVEGKTVYAQNFLSDSAQDVTGTVSLSENILTVPGSLMRQLGKPGDEENVIPALVLLLQG